MAKLYFHYGVMGSSKTANALMVQYNYHEKGKGAWLIKPSVDTRDDLIDGQGIRVALVRSRIGLSAQADVIGENDSIITMLDTRRKKRDIAAIIVDEVQFLSENQVTELREIVDTYNLPVLCYGLRTDFQTKLFPGSKRLMEVADIIEQVKHVCKCGKAAQVNARLDEVGNVITEGMQIEIGGNEKYEAMCWKCYKEKIDDEHL